MLFVGRDWARKGGDRALQVVSELRDAGTPCELTVVGEGPDLPSGARRLGRVDRGRMGSCTPPTTCSSNPPGPTREE